MTKTDLLHWLWFVKHQWKSLYTLLPPSYSSTAGLQPGRFTLPSPGASDGSGSAVYSSKNTERFSTLLLYPIQELTTALSVIFAVTLTSSSGHAYTTVGLSLQLPRNFLRRENGLILFVEKPSPINLNCLMQNIFTPRRVSSQKHAFIVNSCTNVDNHIFTVSVKSNQQTSGH